ncbi:MAG: alpha/beta hydrolase [Actinomycetota bacterium]|nr:alpha/beta hydrolase [Actinomycetota bacterium]
MATATLDGVELYYEERGSGRPLLLVHGTGAYADLWLPVLDGLARTFRVISYDRRGFGRSASGGRVRFADHARDAEALLEFLDAGPATVVGWSGGGVVALELAVSAPERVSALVLAEPAVHLSTHLTRSALLMQTRSSIQRYLRRDVGAAAQTMYRWASGSTRGGNTFDSLPQEWRDQMVSNGPSTVREMDQLLRPHPSRATISSITCPVTIIEGDLSDPAFATADAFMRRLLPHAKFVTLSEAAHFLHIDQPQQWVEAVER